MLSGEATNTIYLVFGWTWPGLNPRSTTLEVSTLTITPSMRIISRRNQSVIAENMLRTEYILPAILKWVTTSSMMPPLIIRGWDCAMVFNTTFNNISVISWQSVLLVEETGVPEENHWPVASKWQIVSHNVVSSTLCLSGIRTPNVSGDRHWLHG